MSFVRKGQNSKVAEFEDYTGQHNGLLLIMLDLRFALAILGCSTNFCQKEAQVAAQLNGLIS